MHTCYLNCLSQTLTLSQNCAHSLHTSTICILFKKDECEKEVLVNSSSENKGARVAGSNMPTSTCVRGDGTHYIYDSTKEGIITREGAVATM